MFEDQPTQNKNLQANLNKGHQRGSISLLQRTSLGITNFSVVSVNLSMLVRCFHGPSRVCFKNHLNLTEVCDFLGKTNGGCNICNMLCPWKLLVHVDFVGRISMLRDVSIHGLGQRLFQELLSRKEMWKPSATCHGAALIQRSYQRKWGFTNHHENLCPVPIPSEIRPSYVFWGIAVAA